MEWLINLLKTEGMQLALRFAVAVVVFGVGFKIVNIIVKKMKSGKGKKFSKMDSSAAGFIASFLSISLKTLILVSVIAIMGVPMSSIVALVASAGVAIGLAVQGALSNFVGGIMILLFKPFSVGDYIEAEGVSGTVKAITVVYTILGTPDNKIITMPNGALTNSIVTNYSTEEFRRVDIAVSAERSTDIEKVKGILLEVAGNCEKAVETPAPAATVTDYTEKGINFALRVWCKNADYWGVRSFLLDNVNRRFKEENINIPFNQVDVHIKKD